MLHFLLLSESNFYNKNVHSLVNLVAALAKNRTKGPLNPATRSLTASSDQEGCGNMCATRGSLGLVHDTDWWICWCHELVLARVLISAAMVVTPSLLGRSNKGICTFQCTGKVGHLSLYTTFPLLGEESRIGNIRFGSPYWELGFRRKSSGTNISTSAFHLLLALLSQYLPQICPKFF